ncbi:MAG TPA: hypothetical protein VGN26_19205 [Armatimonadota bacterium]|jgi:hypothetical protein
MRHHARAALSILVSLAPLLGLTPAYPAEVRLPCTADTNLSSYPAEAALNYGGSSRLRLKGREMWALLKFDTKAIQGWTVTSARLRLHAAGPHKLKTLGLSTIAVDWVEGTGTGTAVPGGATFLEAMAGRTKWGGPQSDFTDAAWTAFGTRVYYADLREVGDGWFEVGVPPKLVYALTDGRSHGLAVTDEKGQTRANNDVYSREQAGSQPVLVVEGSATGRQAEPAGPPASSPPSPPLPAPLKPVTLPAPYLGGPLEGSGLRLWAFPDTGKAHPVSGNLLEEVGAQRYAGAAAGQYRRGSSVWDGKLKAVRLSGARGEFVAFQLCVEALQPPVRFTARLDGLRDVTGKALPGQRALLYSDWYVKDGDWYPELAVPVTGPLSLPDSANRIDGQRNRCLFVELFIPRDAPPGLHKASLAVDREGGRALEVPIEVTVRPFTLPAELSFDVDLNAYGPPGDAATELTFHRMAHEHRATLDILGYNQAGAANPAYVPAIAGSGPSLHVTDWSAFDRRFGPYFDGSAFAGLTRGPVPLKHAYLPLCEGWPSDLRKHYAYQPTTTAYPDLVVEHAMKAPPIEEGFDEQFRQEFQAVAREFARHFREKGWNDTTFEFFMNDKVDFKNPKQGGRGSSWWLLDEPAFRDDWLALRFFGALFLSAAREVVPANQAPRFIFRADVSRPQWQRDWLDGLVNLMCVSGELFAKNERCMEMQSDQGVRFRHYAEANPIKETNLTAVAWALKAYLAGADGILPWNSLGGEEAFTQPAPTALLVPGGKVGVSGPVASLRLKALRRGQQDVEYLHLLAARRGWTPRQLAAAVAPLVDLSGRTVTRFVDDAGQTAFDHLDTAALTRLRETVAWELSRSPYGPPSRREGRGSER